MLCGWDNRRFRGARFWERARRVAEALGLTPHEQPPNSLFAAVLLQVLLYQTEGLQCST
jgi:hypothetical protein